MFLFVLPILVAAFNRKSPIKNLCRIQASSSSSSSNNNNNNNSKFVAKGELFYQVVSKYYQLNGHFVVPRDFVVPSNDESWPEETRGYKLPQKFAYYRRLYIQGTLSPWLKSKLDEIGFVVDPKALSNAHLLEATRIYAELHGGSAASVPHLYKIPANNSRYPQHLWRLRLWQKLQNHLYRGDYNEISTELASLGVTKDDIEETDKRHFDYIYRALVSFKDVFGHLEVDYDFVVPLNDTRFPPDTWSLKLGNRMRNIRYRGDFVGGDSPEHIAQRQKLVDLGWTLTNKRRYKTKNSNNRPNAQEAKAKDQTILVLF